MFEQCFRAFLVCLCNGTKGLTSDKSVKTHPPPWGPNIGLGVLVRVTYIGKGGKGQLLKLGSGCYGVDRRCGGAEVKGVAGLVESGVETEIRS